MTDIKRLGHGSSSNRADLIPGCLHNFADQAKRISEVPGPTPSAQKQWRLDVQIKSKNVFSARSPLTEVY